MHTPPFAAYVECLERGDVNGVVELMLDSASRLAAAGADFLICPDNTIHAAYERVVPRSPRPWLHIAEIVADEAVARGATRIGITGTRWLVDSRVYPDAFEARGLEWQRPESDDRHRMGRIIMEELVYGVFDPGSVGELVQVIERLEARGCDAVVLGCTELPLVLGDDNSPLPTLDSTRLLARAALRKAVEGERRT